MTLHLKDSDAPSTIGHWKMRNEKNRKLKDCNRGWGHATISHLGQIIDSQLMMYLVHLPGRADISCDMYDFAMLPGGSRITCMIYSRTCFLGWILAVQILYNIS